MLSRKQAHFLAKLQASESEPGEKVEIFRRPVIAFTRPARISRVDGTQGALLTPRWKAGAAQHSDSGRPERVLCTSVSQSWAKASYALRLMLCDRLTMVAGPSVPQLTSHGRSFLQGNGCNKHLRQKAPACASCTMD
ncbi:hypothetical protein KFL_008990030 [Klebsormidium nitens]|uniref:Uncharacterized protein n=1 Tax=Klebsormidium nitens TaxID=105231 RepID=A0A1Y1IRW2_KLENI|nr:hypothetical protein KFL_008990030 [Klebsormidium nitens]|eukprot:GAQ91991.1 hypothetical protein KFL_008990030 [Klebsormidium nitens]